MLLGQTELITNCLYYSRTKTCEICRQGFYVVEGRCTAVKYLISNCLYYIQSGEYTTCLVCNSGYVFSIEKATCEYLPVVRNCYNYTYVKCGGCAVDYYQDKNYYLTTLFATPATIYNMLVQRKNYYAYNWVSPKECMKLTPVTNCKKYSPTRNICIECNTGYYL